MQSRVCQFCFCLCAAAASLAAVMVRADEPGKPARESGRALDPAHLQPGTVIVISDNPRDALRQVDAIVLSPAEYKKLLEAAEQVRRAQGKPDRPSTCRLSGRIERRGERGVAVFSATMKFRTASPRTTVAIGLKHGKPTSADVDGRLAVFAPTSGEDGYAVSVDAPGEHELRIEMESPLISRPGETGFEIGLPGAAITVLERLELPKGVASARVAGRTTTAAELAGGTAVLLGPADRLDVQWPDERGAAASVNRLTVEAKSEVTFAEGSAVKRTRMTVKWPPGRPPRFVVAARGEAKMEFEPADSATILDQSANDGQTKWTVRPGDQAADCVVDVESRVPFTFGSVVSVGPARVEGVARQRGTITIGGASDVRLVLEPAAEAGVARRDSPDSAANETTFQYSALAGAGELLRVTPQQLAGQVDTQVQHQLSFTERGWRWQGRLEIRPIRVAVPFIDIETPGELLEFRSASPETVESATVRGNGDGERRILRIQFVESLRKPTTIALEGLFEIPATARDADLAMPRVVNAVDRGGQVTASAPAGVEVHGNVREWTGSKQGERGRALEPVNRSTNTVTAALERAPARVHLSWRAVERESAIAATVYVVLGERQSTVRHQFRVPTAAASSLRLSGPASLTGRIRGVQGTTLQPVSPGEWTLQPPVSATNETIATVIYSFPLTGSAAQRTEELPLVWLDQFADVETDVLIWSGALTNGDRRPTHAVGPWTEMAPPIVADMPAIPSMALHGSGADLPLAITIDDDSRALSQIMVERLWVQALVDQDGRQSVRIRGLLRTPSAQTLQLTLPRPATESQFQASLDGKRLSFAPGDQGDTSIRLRIDSDAARTSRVLELTYVLAPTSVGGGRFLRRIETPNWHTATPLPIARWQIGVGDDHAALFLGSAEGVENWSWERGFWESQPRWTSSSLSKWLIGDGRYGDIEGAGAGSSLTAIGKLGVPISIVLVPRSAAWLVCSLAILGFGIVVLKSRPGIRFGIVVGAMALIGILAAVHWQFVAALALYAQPGMLILALMLAGHWTLDRWRRPTVFQSVGAWSGRPTLPIASAQPEARDSQTGEDEPDLIPLKRV